ncbi:MAG TPA: SDR family NAD(P)-dependent oxidoreductase [Acidimicrobiales bacterium]|nr:SDR family NAD(P)-dependent oxidoreductase [Acidimicrobiales bacterium]
MTVPDQRGKVVVITGANSGIGKETAVMLAAAGASVLITSRDAERGKAAIDEIVRRSGSDAIAAVDLDLSSFESIRSAAEKILERCDSIDVLINNAGGILTELTTTVEGFEATLGGNHVGHFLLTDLLLERLRASAPSRVVTLSSIAHRGARGIGEDDFFPQAGYNGTRAYAKSKLANLQFARELARREREAGSGVTSFAVHPGGVRTGFGGDGDTGGIVGLGIKLIRGLSISAESGAAASVHTATAPGIEPKSGAYYQRSVAGNYGPVVEAKPTAAARDDEACRELWVLTEKVVAAAS